jgi:hypothetical protein
MSPARHVLWVDGGCYVFSVSRSRGGEWSGGEYYAGLCLIGAEGVHVR